MQKVKLSKRLSLQQALIARLKVPEQVKVESRGQDLVISGALGSIQTDLSKLDTEGCAAVQALPATRELAIACCDKAFFGTIQTLIKNQIQARLFLGFALSSVPLSAVPACFLQLRSQAGKSA